MTTKPLTHFEKNLANKRITVTREFAAPVENVWKAWTDSALLDRWWAPKPWKAITKSMDFRVGGYWLYCMAGPDGTNAWARVDYLSIEPLKGFTAQDSFCDEAGIKTSDFPSMKWENRFLRIGATTRVEIEINFASEADIRKITEMGFEEGFTAALVNLDELLEKQ